MHPGREKVALAKQAQRKEKHHNHVLKLCSTFFQYSRHVLPPQACGGTKPENKEAKPSLNQCATSIHLHLSWSHLISLAPWSR